MIRALFLVAVLLALACGDPSLKAAGEECFATSECEQGLTCDMGASPPTCSTRQTQTQPVIDASSAPIDADVAVPDAAPAPDAPPPPPPPPPDAAVPDAAPPDAMISL